MLSATNIKIAIVSLGALFAISGCTEPLDQTYLIGTSRPGTGFSALGEALEEVVNRDGHARIAAVGTKGAVENLERLRAGDLHFGLIQGGFDFEDTGLRSVASVDVEYLHIIVPNDSPIRRFRDLAGKRVATLAPGSGSLAVVENIAQVAQLRPPLVLVQRESPTEAFASPEVDAAMFVTSLRRELAALLNGGGYRLVPVMHANALSVDIFDVRVTDIPAGAYDLNMSIPAEPLPTLAVDTNVLVRADVPDVAVRALTEALFTHQVRSRARLPALNEVSARDDADLMLHPAAESYYSRNAPLRSDQFEIAAFGLAALLTLLSAGRWTFQWLRARNLRVDRGAVSDILQAMNDAAARAPNEEGKTVLDLLDESQKRWLAGRIDDRELRTILHAASAYAGHMRSEKGE